MYVLIAVFVVVVAVFWWLRAQTAKGGLSRALVGEADNPIAPRTRRKKWTNQRRKMSKRSRLYNLRRS